MASGCMRFVCIVCLQCGDVMQWPGPGMECEKVFNPFAFARTEPMTGRLSVCLGEFRVRHARGACEGSDSQIIGAGLMRA